MKRSMKVSLVLMGAVGIGASAYALAPNCTQQSPGAAPGGAQQQQQTCRSSHYGSGHSGWSFFPGSSGATTPSPTSPPAGNATSRGGFGAIGRALASFSAGS
jgi:hypothetical protein